MFASVLSVLAGEQEASHTVDWWIVWSAILLASVTLATGIIGGLQSWISWKTYKIESAKSAEAFAKTTEVANNSIDSMEHVAVVALTHQDRVRKLKALKATHKQREL